MSSSDRLTILRVGLFPDREMLEQALAKPVAGITIARHDLTDRTMGEAAWDQVVDDILSSTKVITV